MSALCPFPSSLPERLGARVQREALAPFPFPRARPAPWALNRVPFDFPELTEFGWLREEEIAAGEQLGEQGVVPTEPSLSPSQSQRGRALRGGIACPDYTTQVIHVQHDAHPANSWVSATGPSLPAPCRIEQVTLVLTGGANANVMFARLLLVDEGIDGVSTTVNGEDLISASRFTNSAVPGILAAQGFQIPLTTQTGGGGLWVMNVGRAVDEPGKRIQLSLLNPLGVAAGSDTSIYVTLLQCAPGAAIAPVSATARAVAARPRPAPSPAPAAPALPPAPRAPAVRGHSSSGAFPVMAGISPAGVTLQRWALPDQPRRTFATLAEAEVAWSAAQLAALPARERFAAATEVRRRAGQLIFGVGELATPTTALLAGTGARFIVAPTPLRAGRT